MTNTDECKENMKINIQNETINAVLTDLTLDINLLEHQNLVIQCTLNEEVWNIILNYLIANCYYTAVNFKNIICFRIEQKRFGNDETVTRQGTYAYNHFEYARPSCPVNFQ